MNEAIQRNLSIEDLIRINEPWCGAEILHRLRENIELVTDISGYWTDEEHDLGCEGSFDQGYLDGRDAGKKEGYKKGYDDAKASKDFDEDYK